MKKKKLKQPYYPVKIPKIGPSKLRVVIEMPHRLYIFNVKEVKIDAINSTSPYHEGVGFIPFSPSRYNVEFTCE
jgi:hypothetical protein